MELFFIFSKSSGVAFFEISLILLTCLADLFNCFPIASSDFPVELGFNNWDCQKTYGDNIKAFMSIKAMDGFLANLGVTDLLYFGVNHYLQKGVVGIPDENYFRLPTVNSSSTSNISNTIFFDENGNLKYNWKNPTTNEYITKTISTD